MNTRSDSLAHPLDNFYELKDDDYFCFERRELIDLIDRPDMNVLEIGCGAGEMGKLLLELGKAQRLTGVELVGTKAATARAFFNEVREGNVEEMSFDWKPGEFDCFVFGDVLEHLIDPWRLIRRLRPYLADDGIAVASLPNMKHLPVLSSLIISDKWDYVKDGVLDIAHLRFFTRNSSALLFSENGYRVDLIRPRFNGRRYSYSNAATLRLFERFLAQGWLLRLRAAN